MRGIKTEGESPRRVDNGMPSEGEWDEIWKEEQEKLMKQRKEKERKIKEGMQLMPLGRKKEK